jgi:hypothetical protein
MRSLRFLLEWRTRIGAAPAAVGLGLGFELLLETLATGEFSCS